ncbi:hypothetical protein [Clostridium intestinale]|jgi:hypothetical protein|nr:hypothetical protein [Clostridium intestinale]
MRIKKNIFNILSAALILVAASMSNPWSSIVFYGEYEPPESLMED